MNNYFKILGFSAAVLGLTGCASQKRNVILDNINQRQVLIDNYRDARNYTSTPLLPNGNLCSIDTERRLILYFNNQEAQKEYEAVHDFCGRATEMNKQKKFDAITTGKRYDLSRIKKDDKDINRALKVAQKKFCTLVIKAKKFFK